MNKVIKGNVEESGLKHRGWFMGWFMDDHPELKTNDFEIKWGKHLAGEKKTISGANQTAKSLAILISGKVRFEFGSNDEEIIIDQTGDYVYWDTGVSHSWEFITDGMTFVIRWPSVPNDQNPSKPN